MMKKVSITARGLEGTASFADTASYIEYENVNGRPELYLEESGSAKIAGNLDVSGSIYVNGANLVDYVEQCVLELSANNIKY